MLSTANLNGSSTVWAQEAQTELGNVIVGYLDYRPSDRTLAVATHGRGVFTTQIPGPTGVGDGPHAGPGRIALRPSMPNPARGPVVISFDLPRSLVVSLRLYDVSGRQVAVLAGGWRERGTLVVRIPTDRLASGAYHCVLRAGGVVETRRVIVTR